VDSPASYIEDSDSGRCRQSYRLWHSPTLYRRVGALQSQSIYPRRQPVEQEEGLVSRPYFEQTRKSNEKKELNCQLPSSNPFGTTNEKTDYFAPFLYLFAQMPVMITKNYATELGSANGGLGKVIAAQSSTSTKFSEVQDACLGGQVVLKPDETPEVIYLQLDNLKEENDAMELKRMREIAARSQSSDSKTIAF
jgi:hypothetical protein